MSSNVIQPPTKRAWFAAPVIAALLLTGCASRTPASADPQPIPTLRVSCPPGTHQRAGDCLNNNNTTTTPASPSPDASPTCRGPTYAPTPASTTCTSTAPTTARAPTPPQPAADNTTIRPPHAIGHDRPATAHHGQPPGRSCRALGPAALGRDRLGPPASGLSPRLQDQVHGHAAHRALPGTQPVTLRGGGSGARAPSVPPRAFAAPPVRPLSGQEKGSGYPRVSARVCPRVSPRGNVMNQEPMPWFL